MTELPSAVQANLQKDFAALQKRTLLCYQCSKCTSVCPAFRIAQFNPRSFILAAVNGGIDAVAKDKTIWGCRNCSSCQVCPMGIDIPSMVLLARLRSLRNDNAPPAAKTGHRRIFNLAQRIQAASPVPPVTNKWPLNHQKFTERGKVALYTGLMPIWDNLMYNYDLDFVTGLRAVLEAMNLVGVEPAIPAGIKDSGHDVYYGGDESTFISLAQYNRDVVEKLGIETLVVVNPEDYHAMKHLYPKYLGPMSADVVFWTDFLVEKGFVEKLRYQAYLDVEIHAAYHDPCKLGRRSGIYASPRVILENMPGIKLVQLRDEKELAPCCGVTAFIGCDDGSLYLRHERLKEARDLGVDLLVTTCPSCVSHYSCALASLQPLDNSQKAKPLQVVELGTLMGTRLFHFDKK
ncbi:MAG: (Fe-S)-binding protein [Candidatus Lokiarchaeota archaeon]|nr:(Fe-S)-binding protein [Candidatus Lokiarchaeota archaeon]